MVQAMLQPIKEAMTGKEDDDGNGGDGGVGVVASSSGHPQPWRKTTNDPWVRLMQAKGCSRARSASLTGRGLMIRQGVGWYWWGKGRVPSGYMSFQISTPLRGIIFLKSHVRGYGRLGN